MKRKKTPMAEADAIFSRLVRSRGACERCGSTRNLQCAHIVPRGYMATRWDDDNALCLDYACHIAWGHRRPLEFELWLVEYVGQPKLNDLRRRALIYQKTDYKALLADLRNREKVSP